MGCDIHVIPERLVDGKWELVEPMKLSKWWYDTIADEEFDRDYDTEIYKAFIEKYTSLSDEEIMEKYGDDPRLDMRGPWDDDYDLRGRNYNWFAILADVRNGSGFAGCDTGDKFTPIAMPRGLPDDASPEIKRESDQWGVDGHSHSWFTLREILDYDWDSGAIQRGYVDASEFKKYIENGKPSSWWGDVRGGNVVRITNNQMKDVIMGVYGNLNPDDTHYTQIEWGEPCRDAVGSQYLDTILDKLAEYGEPEEVRIVFWFDN